VLGNFKTNLPFNSFSLLIYALFLKWPLLLHPTAPAIVDGDAYLYHQLLLILKSWFGDFKIMYGVFTILLLYTQALLINNIANNQKLFSKPNHLTGMCYLLFTSVFQSWFVLNPVMIAATFLILVLAKLSKLQNLNDAGKTLFNLGLLLGLSVLFYFPSIVYLLLIFLSLLITRAFKLPEWVIIILGLLTPYYFACSILFLMKSDLHLLYPHLGISLPQIRLTRYECTALIIIFITASVGFAFVQNNMRKLLVQSRKSWTNIYLFLIVSLIIPFLNYNSSLIFYLTAIISLSVIAAGAFHFPGRKWFPVAAHWSLFILSAIIGYYFTLH